MTNIGYIVGIVFTSIGLLLCAAVSTWFFLAARVKRLDPPRDTYDWPARGVLLGWAYGLIVAALVIAGIFTAMTWPPFNSEYHSYKQVSGVVTEVQGRLVGEDRSTNQVFAVRLAGSDQIYRCDDTRCALLKPGDTLTLWCMREWQQASTPGYVCNFGASTRPEG